MTFAQFNDEADDTARMAIAIAQSRLPHLVYSYHLEFNDDATGEPSVWVELAVDDAAVSSCNKKIAELRTFMDKIRKAAMTAGVSRRPYFRLVDR
jgi:hypothetical protein